jgi:hypothetical protein
MKKHGFFAFLFFILCFEFMMNVWPVQFESNRGLAYGILNSSKSSKVRGIVTDPNGYPVKGIEIQIEQRIRKPNDTEKQVTITSDDGKFEFSVYPNIMVLIGVYPPEKWHVHVSSRWVPPDFETLRFIAGKDTGNTIDFTPIKRNITIKGHIQDPDGKPISDVNILGVSSLNGAISRTDKQGFFNISHPITTQWSSTERIGTSIGLELYVDAKEKKLGCIRSITFNESWEYNINLNLTPYKISEGVVIDPNGRPVANVEILKRNHCDISGLGMRWFASAKTDKAGRFIISDLISGVTYTFCALSEQYGTLSSGRQYLEDNKIPPITVYPRSGHIKGIALKSDGSPFAGVTLSMEPCLGVLAETKSDSEGKFYFNSIANKTVDITGRYNGNIGRKSSVVEDENVIIKLSYEEIHSFNRNLF